jgi:hypothetical protein
MRGEPIDRVGTVIVNRGNEKRNHSHLFEQERPHLIGGQRRLELGAEEMITILDPADVHDLQRDGLTMPAVIGDNVPVKLRPAARIIRGQHADAARRDIPHQAEGAVFRGIFDSKDCADRWLAARR